MPTVAYAFDSRELAAVSDKRIVRAIARALRKAGSTALRDMRSEATKRIRERKRIRIKAIREALVLRRPKGSSLDGLEFRVDVRGKPIALVQYPHRQTRKGVSVEVNRGKRTLVKSAFIATMRNGHTGVFVRRGAKRLPIRELLGSRPVDALLHKGEAEGVARRGAASLAAAFSRLLPMELSKAE